MQAQRVVDRSADDNHASVSHVFSDEAQDIDAARFPELMGSRADVNLTYQWLHRSKNVAWTEGAKGSVNRPRLNGLRKSQRKYVLDLGNSRPIETLSDRGGAASSPWQYKNVGKVDRQLALVRHDVEERANAMPPNVSPHYDGDHS